MKISFIIPCYYSNKTIAGVVESIKNVMNGINGEYEIICVNDGSKDGTYDKIEQLAKKDKRVVGVDLAKNVGQHNAIMAGLNFSTGDYVAIFSDDGQSPVEIVPQMMEALEEGHDAVCAKYVSRDQGKLTRNLGSTINSKVTRWLIDFPEGVKFTIDLMMKRCIVDEIIKYQGPYSYFPGLLFRVTQNVANIETVQKNRKEGKSGYTLKKLFKLFLDGFTAFSVKPLRVSAKLGTLISIIGIIIAIVLVIRKIINPQILVGWSSLAVLLLIIGGIIMIMLGMIGEYVGRIYMCINSYPQYVVRQSINSQKKKDE